MNQGDSYVLIYDICFIHDEEKFLLRKGQLLRIYDYVNSKFVMTSPLPPVRYQITDSQLGRSITRSVKPDTSNLYYNGNTRTLYKILSFIIFIISENRSKSEKALHYFVINIKICVVFKP